MRVVFANVTHGFVYASDLKKSEGMIFRKFSIPDYVEYFKKKNPDILCLGEVLIDDENDKSEFVESLSVECKLEHYKILRSESSWIYVGRYYGMAVLSRYPIKKYEFFKLPNPKFEVDRPNGEHWVMHDKYAQYLQLDVSGISYNIFNLHYFPVHHFNKKLSDPEMQKSRRELTNFFRKDGFKCPTIIAGDFNNKHANLSDDFPELFESGDLDEAVEAETTILDGNAQLDHILFTNKFLKCISSKAEPYLSDHYSLIVDFEQLKNS